MPWWKSSSARANGAQSPSSESSSPQCSSSSPSPSSRRQRRDFGIAWSGRRDVHHQLPRLTRQKKLRHLSHLDVPGLGLDDGVAGVESSGGGWGPLAPVTRSVSCLDSSPAVRSSGTGGSVLRPQPLPLPESAGYHLPSPQRALVRGAGEEANGSCESSYSLVEPIGERFSAATPVGSRFAHHNVYKGNEHVDVTSSRVNSSYSRKAFQDHSATHNFTLIAPPRSAPTSGLSSPALSPRRLSTGDFFLPNSITPGIPVMWSAPECPFNDMVAGCSTQTSPEKMFASPDHSPRYSPTVKSPGIRSRNPSSPPSPLHPKYAETSAAWHDGNGTINVHPLPLPPGGMVTILPSFPLQTAPKNEAATITSQWQKRKLIGSGTFGNVYIATNRHTGALCAMKEVNLIPDDPKTAECIKQLEQEIKVLSQLKHPNIVQYYGSEIIDDRFYIYLEYIYPGSINKYVREHCGAITESVVRNFTRHILKGLAFLHSKKTVHRDIKGANLLVDANGVVKLADFGMAKHLSGATAALSLKGTPHWMAPEVVQATMNKDMGYDLSVDIWSLGCTIIEMFTGKHPWDGFEGAAAMFKVLRESPPIPDTLSAEGKDFLQHCFRRNPSERPSATQLLEHSFVRCTNHHDIQGTMHSFAGLKLAEASSSPSDGTKSKTDPSVKGKHGHSHAEKAELSAIRLSPRSTLEMVPSLSPPRTNQAAHSTSGPSSILEGVQWVGGRQHIPAFSRSSTNEALHPC